MIAIPAIAMMLFFGAPTFAAMTPTLWLLFALGHVGDIKTVVKTTKDIEKLVNSPQFRAWAAANGEAAIRLQPGEKTER